MKLLLCAASSEFQLTFAVPLELLRPLVVAAHLAGFLGLGVGKEIWVGLGDLGGRLMPGKEVAVLRPQAPAVLVCVSPGGGRRCPCAGQLNGLGGRAGELLPGRVHQVGPGRQRRTPVVIVLLGAAGQMVRKDSVSMCLGGKH